MDPAGSRAVEARGEDGRGVLYPTRLPRFARYPAPAPVADRVAWFWIPEWDLAPGRTSRQHLIAFAACNLVVEGSEVAISGPTTRSSYRDLAGRGWAVGALLRPAAVTALIDDPGALADGRRVLDLPELRDSVVAAMAGAATGGVATDGTVMNGATGGSRHERAVAAFADWVGEHLPEPDEDARRANALADLLGSDPAVLRLEDTARALSVSVRTVQRLARRYVGLPPLAMIRRRRLQEAAERLRDAPGTDLAELAAELGYADHAHLTRDFREVLGMTPTGYRSGLAEPS